MRIGTGVLFALGTLGLFGSCKSQDIYNKALRKQYELIDNERVALERNRISVLEPNGRLSSVMGDDVVYFLTKEDSIAFDNQVRLAHGLVTDVQEKKKNELKNITNTYNNSVNSLNGYYNSEQNKPMSYSKKFDLSVYHQSETERLKEHNSYLTKAVNQEYGKEMKQAKRIKASIIRNACRMPGVIIEKGGARVIRSALRK